MDGIYFQEQAQALARSGMHIGVAFPEQQSLRRMRPRRLWQKHFQTRRAVEDGVPTLRRFSWNVGWRTRLNGLHRVWDGVRLGMQYARWQGRPDLIHAQSARWAAAAAARLSATLGVPYVVTEHFSGFRDGNVFSWQWPLVQHGLEAADAVAAVSHPLRRTLETLDRVQVADVRVLPNLVDTAFFTVPPAPRPNAPFRFLTIGHLRPKKNVDGLLRAFARAFPDSDAASADVRLDVVGDGAQRAHLERLATRLGIAPRVTFHGSLPRPAVRHRLWSSHAYVLPSHHETFGVVLIEAMATGLPALATACGGPQDIVTEATGRLISPDDPAALRDGLRWMHAHAAEFPAQRLHSLAARRFGPETFCRRTRSFYEHALRVH